MANEISLPEARFNEALDAYYSFLHEIADDNNSPIKAGQRLVTLNTLTSFPILANKPKYNTFILRAFADLVIQRISAGSAGSPAQPPVDIINSANTGDSWSMEYFRAAFPFLTVMLRKYIQDPEVRTRIEALYSRWDGESIAFNTELGIMEERWLAYAKQDGLSEAADPGRYFREKDNWWRPRKMRLEALYRVQYNTLAEIYDLELAHLDSEGLLYKQLKDSLGFLAQVKLPIRPELETASSDPTNSPGDYDIRPAMNPQGTSFFDSLLDESNDGNQDAQFQRGYSIERTQTSKYTHDTDWVATGSARKFFFLRANLSISEKRHFEEQITKVGKMQVGFRAIQSANIIRGRWYSGTFMESDEFQEYIDSKPGLRNRLRNLITFVIVARGLTVKLNFTTDIHQNSWRDLKVKGSGGLSIGGWNFGLSGHYNSRTEWDITDVTNNSVTFADGPRVCRVLGFKVADVLGDPRGGPRGKSDERYPDEPIPQQLIDDFNSGKISYNQFIDKVHAR